MDRMSTDFHFSKLATVCNNSVPLEQHPLHHAHTKHQLINYMVRLVETRGEIHGSASTQWSHTSRHLSCATRNNYYINLLAAELVPAMSNNDTRNGEQFMNIFKHMRSTVEGESDKYYLNK